MKNISEWKTLKCTKKGISKRQIEILEAHVPIEPEMRKMSLSQHVKPEH